MKRVTHNGQEYIVSRVRPNKTGGFNTELVSISDGTLLTVPSKITATKYHHRPVDTSVVAFGDRSPEFLDELRKKRTQAALKPGPSKRPKSEGSEDGDAASGGANAGLRQSKPRGRAVGGRRAKGISTAVRAGLLKLPLQKRFEMASIMGIELPDDLKT